MRLTTMHFIAAQGGTAVTSAQLHEEIKETNLSYLLLAQNMIHQDQASALFRLGISEEMAQLISNLTPAQLIKMAASNLLVCRFRFDEDLLFHLINDYSKDRLMAQPHAAILMSSQPAAQLDA